MDEVPPWMNEIPVGGDPALRRPDESDMRRVVSEDNDPAVEHPTDRRPSGRFKRPTEPAPAPAYGAPRRSAPAKKAEPEYQPVVSDVPLPETAADGSPLTWENFLAFCEEREGVPLNIFRQCGCEISDNVFRVRPKSRIMSVQLRRNGDELNRLLAEWAGEPLVTELLSPQSERHTTAELKAEMQNHPVIQRMHELFGATLVYCGREEQE